MKPNVQTTSEAPDVKEWRERQLHDSIMEKIASVKGAQEVDYSGPYVSWVEKTLPLADLLMILKRGHHDEILALINAYNHAVSYEEQQKTGRNGYLSMPEEIQELIAKRGDKEEIDAYLACQGFGEKGQKVILERGNHDEILAYVARHGLLENEQRELLKRRNEAEISTHISHHGLADQLVSEMIDDIYRDEDCRLYDVFVAHHELPIFAQKMILNLLKDEVVIGYFSRYGFGNEVHTTLLKRSQEVIVAYLQRHHYLCPEAEDKLATLSDKIKRKNLIKAYIANWKNGSFVSDDHFLSALLKDWEENRDAVSNILLQLPYTESFMRDEFAQDRALIEEGRDEELIERFKNGKPLHIRLFSSLFFERSEACIKAYMVHCTKDVYYLC